MSASRPSAGVSAELATFLAVAVVAVAQAPGAVGWLAGDAPIGAAALVPAPGHGAGAVLIGALASVIPVGELAFRVALVGAVAVALTAAALVALARALVPTAAGAGVIGAALLAVSPAAGATLAGGEGALAAALATWALVLVVRATRGGDAPWRAAPAVGAGAAIGALATVLPLLAVIVAVPVALGLWLPAAGARRLLGPVVALATLALIALPLVVRGDAADAWTLLGGGAPPVGARLIATVGDGTGVGLVFAGLVGLGLGAATGLRGAPAVLGTAIAAALVVALHAPAAFGLVPLALVAAGLAPLAAAVARLGPDDRRPLIATIAAVPIAVIAVLAPRHAPPPDDAGDGVARVAAELLGPAGGPIGANEPAVRGALLAERLLAGATADEPIATAAAATPRYPGRAGAQVAALVVVERARREAAAGDLERAARTAGLVGSRFGASELALLAATVPSPERPPLYGFVPPLTSAPLPPAWLPDLFADDLAWVAGIDQAPLPATAPAERRLHAMWREILLGRRPVDDPAILGFGVAAGRATARMLADLDQPEAAILAAQATLARGEDAATLLVLGSVLAAQGGVGDGAPLDEPRTKALGDAERALGRAVVAAPRLIDARIVLGLVQARLGRRDEARRTWQVGLEVAPAHPELLDLLAAPAP